MIKTNEGFDKHFQAQKTFKQKTFKDSFEKSFLFSFIILK
jgi:hypothetical protein